MKTIKLRASIAVIVALTIISSSCKKNLEEKPYSTLSSNVVFTNEDGLKKVTLGIYQTFTSDPFTAWYRFGLAESGHQYSGQGMFGDAFWSDENRFVGTATSQVAGECNTVWVQDYQVISRANIVIAHAAEAVKDANVAARYVAEARFLRGFAYFDLVRNFGGVPIVDKEIKSINDKNLLYGSRASVQDVYTFIVSDMLAAVASLPDKWSGADLGRVSAGTAKAMLGKVYLTMAGKPLNLSGYYQKAIDVLSEVVGPANEAKYNFGLLPNFTDVFSNNNKRNSEIVLSFSWFYNSSNTGAIMPFFCMPRGFVSPDEQTFYGLTPKFYHLFEKNDVRRDATMITRYKSVYTGDGATLGDSIIYNEQRWKYIDTITHSICAGQTVYQGITYAKFDRSNRPVANPFSFQDDIIIMRFSDVLLCLAEAMIQNGDPGSALPLINRVRTRAGATPYATADDMLNRVRLERRLELTGEYTTVYDIRRWGTLQNEIAAMDPVQVSGGVLGKYDPRFELYPIPLSQIQANPNLTQNPGY